MARDLKHRVPAFRTKKRKPLSQRLILIGLLLAAFTLLATFAVRWLMSPNEAEPTAFKTEAQKETHFSYFRLLEDRESLVPESRINEEQRNLRLGQKPTEGAFSLLVGTYKTREQADSVRRQLTQFAALKPKMEEITLEFASWFRIKLGPYATLRDANQVRLFLREQGIDSVLETHKNR